jgi:hypothetical protein
MKLLWILAGLVLIRAAPTCTTLEELETDSYTACILLPNCRDAFYLSEAPSSYEKKRFKILFGILWEESNPPLTVTMICSTDDTFTLWLELLSQQHFCRDNEIYTEWSGTCVCRTDKHCDTLSKPGFGLDALWMWFAVVALALVFAYFAYQLITKTQTLGR